MHWLHAYYQMFRISKLRQVLWPVRSHELAKFVPMALLMFTVLLNQNIVRGIKDSLVMTRMGPEVISFIKLWGEMPAGIAFVLLYAKLCNRMNTERVFRYVVAGFLSCFALFGFLIYPYRHLLHPDPLYIEQLIAQMPHLKWFLVLWGQWSFCLLYILGELWPTIVFSLLYWQLANKITRTEEAGRFYSFFSLFGQANLLFSGAIIVYFARGQHLLSCLFSQQCEPTEVMLKSLMSVVLLSGAICLLLHRFIEKRIILNPRFTPPSQLPQPLKLGLRESARMILSSRYLGLICVLMISYSMAMNLIEGLWLSKVHQQYPSTEQFIGYCGQVLFWTGVFTLLCSFVGSSIIRYFGWFWGAVTTPLMVALAGTLFFLFVAVQDQLHPFGSPLAVITFIGALQNVLGKGTKYSLFDATKEMAYIPLNDEMKTKGKAAVDVIGTKIGKSSGAILQFLTFTWLPDAHYDDIVYLLMSLFTAVCLCWIYSVFNLSKSYEEQLKKHS